MRIPTAVLPAAALLLGAADLPGPGEPALTPQTARSGGPIDPEQAKLSFDAADLRFEVFPEAERIAGVAALSFTARAPLDRLLIDLDRNLPVSAVAIDGVALPARAWSNPEGKLTITLPHRVAAGGRVSARITYAGTPHVAVKAPWDDGFVWAKTPDGHPWVATTAEGNGCDLFWPCLDFPTGRPGVATLHITVPAGLKAPSNGKLLGIDTLADGRTTWTWRVKHPTTYGIALNVGPYEQLSGSYKSRFGNTIPLFYWYLPGEDTQARALFAEFAPALDFFESEIGPYPFGDEKLGVVETPHKGMEHQTINAYGNGYAKAPEGFDWLFQHELAHEWFGNQLSARDWDDFWLHEGYATYMQPFYGLWREGDARYATMLDDQRDKITNLRPMVSGASRTEEDVYRIDRGGPGQDIYYKGAWMLHTLRWLIGDRAFRDVTRLAVYGRSDPKPGNFTPRFVTSANYQAIVTRVTGKDYGWFFDVYLRQAALPDLLSERRDGALNLHWAAPGGRPFPMPVAVRVAGRTVRLAMANGTGRIAVAAGAHVVIDPDARVLRRSAAVEAYQAWRDAQRKAQ
ncbi:M1 family metallopeptidase [Sphingomonas sp. H39-1-10]|uniref:M1 family metallopeptidase n=1 Tax=Sphingomonas pollutisoli TaxID=3030829 RepID=UPI0023BA39E7|nr:M1 family metallopeptidase [Sphingomonas pollutisoli]MDF0489524.1 M1 family metallopeptidase [Sphingomonas pollutisoli]